MATKWFRKSANLTPIHDGRPRPPRCGRLRPRLEELEGRWLPSVKS